MEPEILASIIQGGVTIIANIIIMIGGVLKVKKDLKLELSRHHKLNYMENYKNIEYDIMEALQLSIRFFLGWEKYYSLDFKVSRVTNGWPDCNLKDRLYRLGGYLSTYGSKESEKLLIDARKLIDDYEKVKRDKSNADYFCKFVSILSTLLFQIKADIFNEDESDEDRIESQKIWLQIRLPISVWSEYKDRINTELSECRNLKAPKEDA